MEHSSWVSDHLTLTSCIHCLFSPSVLYKSYATRCSTFFINWLLTLPFGGKVAHSLFVENDLLAAGNGFETTVPFLQEHTYDAHLLNMCSFWILPIHNTAVTG